MAGHTLSRHRGGNPRIGQEGDILRQGQRIVHGKLVRDRIPEIIEAAGKTATVRVLDEAELIPALISKLAEEAEELRHAEPDDRLGELASVDPVEVGFDEHDERPPAALLAPRPVLEFFAHPPGRFGDQVERP